MARKAICTLFLAGLNEKSTAQKMPTVHSCELDEDFVVYVAVEESLVSFINNLVREVLNLWNRKC